MSLDFVKSSEMQGFSFATGSPIMVKPYLQHMPKQSDKLVYEFDGFSVDVVRRQLLRGRVPVQLTSKAFDTLLMLVRHRGSTVSKTDLMNSIWADSAVEENNLTQQISTLRRVLGEKPRDHRFIVTVPGHGYCFAAELVERDEMPRTNSGWFTDHFDAAAMRGYSLAMGQILLILSAIVWSFVSDSGRPQSLAVLNFKVASTGDEIIGNGISETLRARLGSVEDLVVRPAAADHDALDAGRRLRVDTVVTGSVQRDQDRIRVAVEVLDISDGRIVWGKTFDHAASNVFDLQDAIAGEVADALKVKLSSGIRISIRPHDNFSV